MCYRYVPLDGGSALHKASTYTQYNFNIKTTTPRVRLESSTPVFERAKTAHGLDCAATVIGR
jgi:hypothetical protein